MWIILYLKYGFDIFNKKYIVIKFDYDNYILKKYKNRFYKKIWRNRNSLVLYVYKN